MAEWKEHGRFLVGLAGEIKNNVTRELQNVGQTYTNQLTGLLTVISAQGVSQVVGSFGREPTKHTDWFKSIEKFVLIAGGDDNQSKRLAYQTSRGAVSDYIQRYPQNSWEQIKSELNVRFAEVNYPYNAFTMLHKARQVKT